MILFLIFVGIAITIGIIAAIVDEYDKWDSFFAGTFISGIALTVVFMFVQLFGLGMNTKVEEVKYSVPIVSINDGTGVEGQMYGGLFVTRGYINDTQHFSYYKNNGNGSYSLEKREADRSVIIPDATPETARLDITDSITTCKTTWWSMLCQSPNPSGIYVHGEFHVPANSIKNEFELDAQ